VSEGKSNWRIWDEQHRGIARLREQVAKQRSADKLAAQIKGALGAAVPKEMPGHGSGGSVVHHTTKKDMKRPAPVKGEKDRADSMRTQIRMAAYQRQKSGETATAHEPPKTEQKVNPHQGRSADKLADQIKGGPTGDRDSGGKSTFVARHGGHVYTRTSASPYTHAAVVRDSHGQEFVASYHGSEAAARKGGAGMQVIGVVPLERHHPGSAEAKSAIVSDRARTRQIMEARKAPESAKPSAERTANHFAMVSGRATLASETAKSASDHRSAAEIHDRAAQLAPTAGLRMQHQNLAANHRQAAQVEDRAEAARTKARDEARKAAEARHAETQAAIDRVKARQDQMENLSDRAEGATAKTERENTREAHQAASDAHQRAADFARQMGAADRAQHHQYAAGVHQMAADGPRKRTGRAGDRSMDKSTKTAAPSTNQAHAQLYETFRQKAVAASATAHDQDSHHAAAQAHRGAAQAAVTSARRIAHERQAAKHDEQSRVTNLPLGNERRKASVPKV